MPEAKDIQAMTNLTNATNNLSRQVTNLASQVAKLALAVDIAVREHRTMYKAFEKAEAQRLRDELRIDKFKSYQEGPKEDAS